MRFCVVSVLSFILWPLLETPPVIADTVFLAQEHFITVKNSSLSNKDIIKPEYETNNLFVKAVSQNGFNKYPVRKQFQESSKGANKLAKKQLTQAPQSPGDSTKNQLIQTPQNNNETIIKDSSQYETDNKIITMRQNSSESSNNSNFLTNNIDKSEPFSDIQALNQFFQNNSPLKIHNKALELLKDKNNAPAILLLKKNFYQNLFPASYFLLTQLEESVFLLPILLLIAFIIVSLITTAFFILYLKTFSSFYLKNLFNLLFVFALLIGGNLILLKNRVSLLEEISLKLAPIETAPNTVQILPLKELVILKKQGKWLKIKSPQNQTGWILKQQVFQLF